jgi:hypothetical protein
MIEQTQLHRVSVNYACAVERPEELTTGEKAVFAIFTGLAFIVFCAFVGFLWAEYGHLLRDAWQLVGELMGVKQ